MNKYTHEMIGRLEGLGVKNEDAWAIRRISMTLHRWAELECGDGNDYASWAIERDEESGKPFMCVYPHKGGNRRNPVADRETGALNRMAKIMGRYPSLWFYHQGDPRGASVYVGKKDGETEINLDSLYTRGVAVSK